MVSGISEQNNSLSSSKSKGEDEEEEEKKDDADAEEEEKDEKPKKKKGKGKKKGIETCDDPLKKIEEIEGQINMIVEIIPQIKDVGRKTGLIKSIAPVLEDSMTELVK
jgi:hypothetical protein